MTSEPNATGGVTKSLVLAALLTAAAVACIDGGRLLVPNGERPLTDAPPPASRREPAARFAETVPDVSPVDEMAAARPADDGPAGHPLLGLSRPAVWARWNALRGDAYELDSVDRFIEDSTGRLECSGDSMIDYGGTHVRYYGPVRINPLFQVRLVRFEEVVSEVAVEFYGRAPRRIRHMGAYSCRVSRNRTHRLSEHALGNAIDIAGFDFGPAGKDDTLAPGAPARLRYAFEVRVARHWSARRGAPAATHSLFLQALAQRLVERRDIFRVALGPSHRGHHDHLHFDMSPWRYVHL
jgi:hypothetical protein